MSECNEEQDIKMSEDTIVSEVVVSEAQKVRGPRGVLGTATAGLTIKQLWASSDSHLSLRQFARTQVREGNPVARAWFGNKAGARNAPRSEANIKAAREAAAATHTERRKPKKGNKAAA